MQRFLKEEDRVALRTQQIGLRQFCYQGGAHQIAWALLIAIVEEYKEDQKLIVSSGGSVSTLNISQTAKLIAHLESHNVYESIVISALMFLRHCVYDSRQDAVAARP
ncbi:hypothetical protein HE1_00704 [Holospora elegans E1]|uniref:Uncharacterized protein n=1 Tax=Holospora elegans E1 TaxID=1427503 RepID=A0A023DZK0_9PROT|nr:hypothetical protein [Holospora elegans]GAJ46372.1 hypothetical protein HE1_00704 [Holospora elegans E1]